MLNTMLIAVGTALLAGCSSGAPTHSEPTPPSNLEFSRLSAEYDSFACTHATPVPDADPKGITIGPVSTSDDGHLIESIMLGLDITHSYVGDIEIRLLYDEDRDGKFDATTTLELYRARANEWTTEDPWAYPVVLDGLYYFKDDVPHDASIVGTTFVPFDGRKKGGDFYLAVVDTSAGNIGTLRSWTVYTKRSDLAGSRLPDGQ